MHQTSVHGYIADESIKLHPLFVKWSAKSLGTIVAARSDLATDLSNITPTMESQHITEYLVGLFFIAGGQAGGILAAPL
jgi:hypothetical protein